MKILEKIPLYPFLFALYPVIYLLAENVGEVKIIAGVRTALLFLLLAGLAFGFALLLIRDGKKSALVALGMLLCFFLIFFFLYAPLYRLLRETMINGRIIGRHRILVPASAILVLLSGFLSTLAFRRMKPKSLQTLTFGLNAVSVILLLIPVVTLLSFSVREKLSPKLQPGEMPALAGIKTTPAKLPDIYLIILDMHTSDNALRELTGYSDSAFSAALKDRGFYIAECSRSNYPTTQYSLTSELNLDYLQNLSDSTDLHILYQYMQSSRVQRTLQEAGYHIYAFETGYSYTELKNADKLFTPVSSAVDLLTYPGVTPFESLILQVSGGKILYETRDQLSQKMQYLIDASYVEYRDRILYQLQTLPAIHQEEGPRFVFAHILAPHSPFVFDRNGDFVPRRTPFSLTADPEGYDFYEFGDAYFEELLYLHSQMLDIVDQILAESETPPIIVINGDHGIPRAAGRGAQFEILNAIYLGNASPSDLYSTISPVNTFRVVFNQLFNTNYPLLADETYIFDADQGSYSAFTTDFTCP